METTYFGCSDYFEVLFVVFGINRRMYIANKPNNVPRISLNQSDHSAVRGAKYMGCRISTSPPRKIGNARQTKMNPSVLVLLFLAYLLKSKIKTQVKPEYKSK